MDKKEIDIIRKAFDELLGELGNVYALEIINNKKLSHKSYIQICDIVIYNGKDSVVKYFGIIQHYYFECVRKQIIIKK